MKLNQNIQALENFFASNAVKNIFDNIRNLVLSTVVLIAGNFLLVTIVPVSESPQRIAVFGQALRLIGFLLLFLCVFHGYYLLKRAGISIAIARLFSVAYFSLAVVFFFALLRSKGFTFG